MWLERLKQWLIFFRAHTGMLEAPIAAFGAAAALGSVWEIEVVLWALAGLAYHYAGYGQNSYYDWEGGYDKSDPHKQHHPLNTEEIQSHVAKIAANGMVAFTVVLMLVLIGLNFLPIALLVTALTLGVAYNVVGKEIEHKYVLISLAHSMLFLIPYTLYASTIKPWALLVFASLVIHHCFQIAISGDVKDIEREESSILDKIGVVFLDKEVTGVNSRVSDVTFVRGTKQIVHSRRADLIISGITGLQIGILLPVVWNFRTDVATQIWFIVLFSALTMALVMFSLEVISPGPYDRSERMGHISMRELTGFWLIYTTLIPIIGFVPYMLSFLVCILYLVGHLKLMWGTYLRPQV